jgi:Family of unknown function (DUF6221)
VEVRGVTDDPVAWLRAQWDARERELAEDERVATAAYPDTWSVEATRHENEFLIVPDHFPSSAGVARGEANAEHIARWDPARVLREVAVERADIDAKRRILDHCATMLRNDRIANSHSNLLFDLTRDGLKGLATQAEIVLRLLALPMAGHEGYRSEWAP